MNHERKSLERLLAVGSVVMVHTDLNQKHHRRYKSVLRGWRRDDHILLDRPRGGQEYAALGQGQECIVRFLNEGQACAFDTTVIDWDEVPSHAYLRLHWPEDVEFISFRRFERLKLQVPCLLRFEVEKQADARLCDISFGGCAFFSRQKFTHGAHLTLDANLPNGAQLKGLKVVVRNVRKKDDGYSVGCEFAEGQEQVETDIVFYVTAALNNQPGEAEAESAQPRVLIIENDVENYARLKLNFEKKGISTLQATNTIDGMYRLRLAPPPAILVNHAMPDLAGLDICRLIKSNEQFDKIPLYLYNAPESVDTGASIKMYPSGIPNMLPNIAFDVARSLNK